MSVQQEDLRIEPVRDPDVSTCVGIITRAFSQFGIEQKLGNTADEAGRKAAGERHLRAWREHYDDTGAWPPVQCIHRDPQTGKDTAVACAEWFIYPRPELRDDQRGANYLISGTWLPEDEKMKLQRIFRSSLDTRAKCTAGRGYGLLMYMATDPQWRRNGAATLCVEWGVSRCKELGIPAYLEASKEGAPVYQRLGFEIVDDVHMEVDGDHVSFPAMMWYPPDTEARDKASLVHSANPSPH